MTDFKLNHTYKMTWEAVPTTGDIPYLIYTVDSMDDTNIHVTIIDSYFAKFTPNMKKTFKRSRLHDQIEDITNGEE